MEQTGKYTGERIKPRDFDEPVTIGKIVGFTGRPQPVYALIQYGEKVGELQEEFIEKELNKPYLRA